MRGEEMSLGQAQGRMNKVEKESAMIISQFF